METSRDLAAWFASPLWSQGYEPSDHPEAEAALPDVALAFLVEAARTLPARRVFEFGSGRSTKALLAAGLEVTSLEHTAYWMEQTCHQLAPDERLRHTALVEPLQTIWQGGVPFKGWQFSAEILTGLQQADLILIDAPYHVSFREATLVEVLRRVQGTPVILDDTRLRTIQRFCDRVVRQNPRLLHARSGVGHGLDCFARVAEGAVRNQPAPWEWVKAWRRFAQGRRR